MQRRLLSLILFLLPIALCAQELKVIEDLKVRNTDVYARTHKVYVGEGEEQQLCAAIKVALVLPEVQFGGSFFKQQSEGANGEYIVYVAPGCKKLKVMSGSFLPYEHIFPFPVESGVTYQLVLGLPESSESLVRFVVNVKNAEMDVAGKHYITEEGFFEVRLPKGKYDYRVTTDASGFESFNGSVDVNDIFKLERVNLSTAKTFKLTINAEDNSRIVIDGTQCQKTGSQMLDLAAGLHTIEAYMGTDERWTKRITVDMTDNNALADMSMRGNLRIVYPTNSQFELTPVNNALKPTKKTIKSGETIALLGDYDVKVIKKNYAEIHANVTIAPNTDIDNFRIEVSSKADNYFYGINGEKQNYSKAFKEYEKMSKKDDDIAQFKLAQCYDNGYGTMKNLANAKKYYKMASDAGHNEATYALATLIDDNNERAEYYIKAADQGNLLSMKITGDYFMQLRAYQEAKNYYIMAIKTGSPKTDKSISDIQAACYASLGEIYYQGLGCTRDLGQAREYFTKGAAMDNVLATERLIDYIYFGYNGKPDQAYAIKHYVQIGDSLTDEAKLRVGLYKYEQQAYTEANKYFSQLMNSNVQLPDDIGEIYYMMGEKMYNDDVPAAFYYYSTAHKRGFVKPRQMVRLGYMYMNGKGTGVDYLRAKEAFEKASLLNDQEGTCMLGYMYERGRGVIADKDKAIRLYEKAGRAGYMKAYNNLGTLYASLKKMDNAVKYWEMAANANNKTAIDNLITYYKNRKNKEKENYWKSRQKQIKGAK